MNGPGEVLHAFDAEAGEELSVYAGEEVSLIYLPIASLKQAVYLQMQAWLQDTHLPSSCSANRLGVPVLRGLPAQSPEIIVCEGCHSCCWLLQTLGSPVWSPDGHGWVQVEVVAEVDGWLHCVASNGAKGLVPSSYVRLLGAGELPGLQQQPSRVVGLHAFAAHIQCQLCTMSSQLDHQWTDNTPCPLIHVPNCYLPNMHSHHSAMQGLLGHCNRRSLPVFCLSSCPGCPAA